MLKYLAKFLDKKGKLLLCFLHIGEVWNFWTHWSEREVSEKLYVCHYDRNSRSQKLVRIGILKNFTIFTGNYLYWSLFLIKRDSHKCFPVNFAKLLKTAFFIEHLPLAASVIKKVCAKTCEIIQQSKGLFTWDKTSHPGGMFHLSVILFIPRLHGKNIPPEWDIFHPI